MVPKNRQSKTTKGGFIFVLFSKRNVPAIIIKFKKGSTVKDVMSNDKFRIKMNVAPAIIPTTAAFIPSSDLKIMAYLFKLCHTG